MCFVYFNFSSSSFRLSSPRPSSSFSSSSSDESTTAIATTTRVTTTDNMTTTTTTTTTLPEDNDDTNTHSKTAANNTTSMSNNNNNNNDIDIHFRGGIIGILTAPQNFELRNKYRSTWMKNSCGQQQQPLLNNQQQEQNDKDDNNDSQHRFRRRHDIRCYFILDSINNTPDELQSSEQHTTTTNSNNEKNDDILFLNTTALGKGIKNGQKLAIFYKWCKRKYPNLLWIAKMDDDVALCPTTTTTTQEIATTSSSTTTTTTTETYPMIFDIIFKHYSPTLYLGGYQHGYNSHNTNNNDNNNNNNIKITSGKYRMDEMFVVLGSDLITKITSKPIICDRDVILSREDCIAQNGLWDMNSGGRSIGLWLQQLQQEEAEEEEDTPMIINVVPLNDYVIHFGKNDLQAQLTNKKRNKKKFIIPTNPSYELICIQQNKLLYHKANTTQMDSIWFG